MVRARKRAAKRGETHAHADGDGTTARTPLAAGRPRRGLPAQRNTATHPCHRGRKSQRRGSTKRAHTHASAKLPHPPTSQSSPLQTPPPRADTPNSHSRSFAPCPRSLHTNDEQVRVPQHNRTVCETHAPAPVSCHACTRSQTRPTALRRASKPRGPHSAPTPTPSRLLHLSCADPARRTSGPTLTSTATRQRACLPLLHGAWYHTAANAAGQRRRRPRTQHRATTAHHRAPNDPHAHTDTRPSHRRAPRAELTSPVAPSSGVGGRGKHRHRRCHRTQGCSRRGAAPKERRLTAATRASRPIGTRH